MPLTATDDIIGRAAPALAEQATVPVAVHLDHAESQELVHEAVRLGFTSVMFDASKLPYGQNVAATRDAVLDFDLIARLRDATGVPLVLHGSSGVSDGDLAKAVAAGMTKVNISTHLNGISSASVRRELHRLPGVSDSRKYLGPAREEVAAEVARLLGVLAGA